MNPINEELIEQYHKLFELFSHPDFETQKLAITILEQQKIRIKDFFALVLLGLKTDSFWALRQLYYHRKGLLRLHSEPISSWYFTRSFVYCKELVIKAPVLSTEAAKQGWRELSFLPDMPQLEQVEIGQASISHFKHLGRCKQLRSLGLSKCQIESLEGLELAPNLQNLELRNCPIQDQSHLAKLQRLNKLYINSSAPVNPACLPANLSDTLCIEFCQQQHLDGMAVMPYLKVLNLNSNALRQIPNLAGFERLEELFLYDNPISELGSLQPLPNLKSLILGSSPYGFLQNPRGKNSADLAKNDKRLADLNKLKNYPKLQTLFLALHPEADISPILELPALEYLGLSQVSRPQWEQLRTQLPDTVEIDCEFE